MALCDFNGGGRYRFVLIRPDATSRGSGTRWFSPWPGDSIFAKKVRTVGSWGPGSVRGRIKAELSGRRGPGILSIRSGQRSSSVISSSRKWQATLYSVKHGPLSQFEWWPHRQYYMYGRGALAYSAQRVWLYLQLNRCRARLVVLEWVSAWVLDCEARPTHWTGCQVGQVVALLGLGSMVANSDLLPTAIRHVSWVNGSYLITGVFSGQSGFLPPIKNREEINNYGHVIGENWFRLGLGLLLCAEMAAGALCSPGSWLVWEWAGPVTSCPTPVPSNGLG